MAKNEELGLAVKLALTIILFGCLVVIVGGVWLSQFPLFDVAPFYPICRLQSADGSEYTVYRSEGGTTVGSSVGIYRGRNIDSTSFHRWAYAAGEEYRVGRSGDLVVVMVSNRDTVHNRVDTLIFDLNKKSDYRVERKELSQPIIQICSKSVE